MKVLGASIKFTSLAMTLLGMSVVVVGLFVTGLVVPPASASDNDWAFVFSDDASYRVEESSDAQDGENLVVIDGTRLNFPIEYQKEDRYWYSPFRPRGYLYQSVKAKPYISKHLHISGFARGIKPNFTELEKQFSDYYESAQQVRLSKLLGRVREADKEGAVIRFKQDNQARYQEKLLEFKQFIRASYKSAQYGIAVLLDMGDGRWGQRDIRAHGPTSYGAPRLNELWNRFNVEVSVPEGCQSVSIVLWQQGVAISEFDHLVVSEQGDEIDTSTSNFGLDDELLLKKIVENDLVTKFSNLSFE